MLKNLLSRLPEAVKLPLREIRTTIMAMPNKGSRRFCPVCERSSRRFISFGVIQRDDAKCVYCGSLERHRLVWLFLKGKTTLFDGNKKLLLHVAPEPCIESRLKKTLGTGYLSADLRHPGAMLKLDISKIDLDDNSFDVIICNHVLEHVPNDKEAIKEIQRVLKPNGWAILSVPITAEVTYEDDSVSSPSERLKHFGQKDHVRRYGPDFIDRLLDAGFGVTRITPRDVATPDECITLGLTAATGEIYCCTKREGS